MTPKKRRDEAPVDIKGRPRHGLVALGPDGRARVVPFTSSADVVRGDGTVGSVPSGGYSDEQAQDAVGTILADTATIDLTYNDGAPSIAADVKSASIGPTQLTTAAKKTCAGIVIDGGGVAITTGLKGYVEVPWAMTIQEVRLLADQVGSIVIDIWKDTYANFPPTVADTITASAKPTLSSAQKYSDATLTGWTTSVSAGDILAFNVDSVATVTRVILQLVGIRT